MSKIQRKWYETLLTRLLTLLGFSSTFAFMACYAPPTEDYDYLVVNPSELLFLAEGGMQSVHIETEDKWEVNFSSNFVNVTPTMGEGRSNIFVTARRNEEEHGRDELIQIRGIQGKTSAFLRVWQEGVFYYLYVNPDSIIFPSEKGQTMRLWVSTNSEWSISTVPSFVEASPMSAFGSDMINLTTTSENDSTGIREGLLTVQGPKGHIQSVIVKQQQK